MNKTKIFSICFQIGFMGILCSPLVISATPNLSPLEVKHTNIAPDSIGTEIINGEIYIIHQVERKETYYALGRRYNAQVNAIMSANNKKNLRPGDTVKIPTGRKAAQNLPEQKAPDRNVQEVKPKNEPIDPKSILTEYKVGKSETLYAISRRFNTTVEAIQKLNNLSSDTVKEGQFLKIPDSDYVAPVQIVEQPAIILDTPTTAIDPKDLGFETNRYGIREKTEKGIGIWMENLETDGKSNLALHKTAPVGTILKITNPMTKNVTYAKVVGKFADNAETQSAIVVLSKSAAAYIGALDRRFLIEIAYGVPLQ